MFKSRVAEVFGVGSYAKNSQTTKNDYDGK